MEALVVFHDHGNHWLDPLLKPGFRHVFAAVLTENGYWVRIDPKNGVPEIRVEAGADYDLAAFYWSQGFRVVETRVRNAPPFGPAMLANCVGVVKALIGLRAPFIITPFQLYRRLTC